MPMFAQRFLKPIVPPVLWNVGKDLKRRLLRSVDHFAYAPQGWSTTLPGGAVSEDFWTNLLTNERVAREALGARVKDSDRMMAAHPDEEVRRVLFGYVLALAARGQQACSVLDYGGHLGDGYWLGLALLPHVDLEYHSKELPSVARAGRRLAPAVTWHVDDGCLARPYDLVMFSSSLQYVREWQDVLSRAAHCSRGYLFLSGVPTVREVPSFMVTQRLAGLTNLQYQLNQSAIVDTVERAGLRLIREFDMGEHPAVEHAPEQPACVGLLFQRDRPK